MGSDAPSRLTVSGLSLLLGGMEENALWKWHQNPTIFSAQTLKVAPTNPVYNPRGFTLLRGGIETGVGSGILELGLLSPPPTARDPALAP